jgi:hypothetical protein
MSMLFSPLQQPFRSERTMQIYRDKERGRERREIRLDLFMGICFQSVDNPPVSARNWKTNEIYVNKCLALFVALCRSHVSGVTLPLSRRTATNRRKNTRKIICTSGSQSFFGQESLDRTLSTQLLSHANSRFNVISRCPHSICFNLIELKVNHVL